MPLKYHIFDIIMENGAFALWGKCSTFHNIFKSTVKPVLSGHSKVDKTKILMTNGSLMKVESIAECSPWSILQYF